MQRIAAVGATVALAVVTACSSGGATPAERGDPLDPASIRSIVGLVSDWQLKHPEYEPADWTNAVFYTGIMAAYRVTGDDRYRERLIEIGEDEDWKILPRYRHADDHAVAQTYLELFDYKSEPRFYEDFQNAIDRMMVEPPDWAKEHQPIDYWWCDALFMSPPAIAKLARITGESAYLEFMDRLWRESFELLYNREQGLFHRDLRFRGSQPNVFWSRGNGWVLAGLARLIDELPAAHPTAAFYRRQFQDLAGRVAELQPEDGMWRADLLARPDQGAGESSGTALFCFALAWGINQGLLDREGSLPAVERAWVALEGRVDERGRLGGVQKPGAKPGKAPARNSEVYATGAFLLAAEQMLVLAAAS